VIVERYNRSVRFDDSLRLFPVVVYVIKGNGFHIEPSALRIIE